MNYLKENEIDSRMAFKYLPQLFKGIFIYGIHIGITESLCCTAEINATL